MIDSFCRMITLSKLPQLSLFAAVIAFVLIAAHPKYQSHGNASSLKEAHLKQCSSVPNADVVWDVSIHQHVDVQHAVR
ncbi:unnamed protein product [Anisakis simplex]|uniref:Secreted protein n=1 Tax=Anisakis simplex TaxID=6269 RepID=A0A0M3IYG3_ANISI|nr:unnamed protein product [Anisakis simplex]